eukprot:5876893-Prymnesium_polylepis.1
MRSRVGLGPFDPPLGLPIEPPKAAPPAASPSPAPAPSPVVCGDAVEVPPASPALPLAIAWTRMLDIR